MVRSSRQSTQPQESSRCLASLAAESPCVPQVCALEGRWASTFGTLVGKRIARDELMLVAAPHFHRTVATHKWCDMCSLEL